MVVRRNWTVEEVRRALALYLVTPFGRIHNRNPQVIALAGRIGRTASAVALKMSNLAALDESLPRKGMANASAMDRRVWAEFLQNPGFVVQAQEEADDFVYQQPDRLFDGVHLRESPDRAVHSLARVGQEYFRKMILTSYRQKCGLTGIEEPKLLVASHIVGWATDKAQRLNPQNGICLNALHDRAFDRHLISFDEEFRVLLSARLPAVAKERLGGAERLILPERFLPDQTLLARHRAVFYQQQAA